MKPIKLLLDRFFNYLIAMSRNKGCLEIYKKIVNPNSEQVRSQSHKYLSYAAHNFLNGRDWESEDRRVRKPMEEENQNRKVIADLS